MQNVTTGNRGAADDPPVFRTRRWGVITGLAGLGLAALLWSTVCAVPGIPWNAPRLAPAFAVSYGLPIYALRDSALHLGWFYGPGFPLWYLPVTLTENPTLALVLSGIGNTVTLLAPLAGMAWIAGVARGRFLWGVAIVGGVLLYGQTATHFEFYFVHVDAVCCAWGFLACAGLWWAVSGRGSWALHLAALALALAIWTKQIAVMLVPAMLCWLWFERQGRWLGKFLLWSVVYGGIVTALIFRFFGAAEVLFNTWYAHVRNPWMGGAALLVFRLRSLLEWSWVWLPIGGAAIWWWRSSGKPRLPGPAAAVQRLLLWVAAWQLPLGFAAVLKAGGGLNSIHSVHYAFAAGLIWICHLLGQPAPRGRPGVRLGLLWAGALAIPLGNGLALALEQNLVWTPFRGQEEWLAMVRQQPGRFYFPWNPLPTLIAERRILPFDDALFCLWKSGLEVPAGKVREAVGPNPVIVYAEPAESHFALRYFPAMRRGPASGP